MRKFRPCFHMLLLAGLLVLSGCATADKSGFLPGYERLHRGRYIENYWASAELSGQILAHIYVEPVKGQIADQSGITVADACG